MHGFARKHTQVCLWRPVASLPEDQRAGESHRSEQNTEQPYPLLSNRPSIQDTSFLCEWSDLQQLLVSVNGCTADQYLVKSLRSLNTVGSTRAAPAYTADTHCALLPPGVL